MKLQDLAKLLDGIRPTAQGFIARCPAHDDQNPSLSIAEGRDKRLLVRCWAGCSATDICQALGIRLRDLFPNSTRWRRR